MSNKLNNIRFPPWVPNDQTNKLVCSISMQKSEKKKIITNQWMIALLQGLCAAATKVSGQLDRLIG